MTNLSNTQVVTGEVRLSYVQLFEPRAFNEGDTPKYSVTILIPKNTKDGLATHANIMTAFKNAAANGAQKHFNGKVPGQFKHTLKDGDTETEADDMSVLKKEKSPELAGHWYMRIATTRAPKVFSTLSGTRQEVLNPLEVYSGMYGKISLSAFAYSGAGNRGVTASLNNVMITKDGEQLGGVTLTGDEFGDE